MEETLPSLAARVASSLEPQNRRARIVEQLGQRARGPQRIAIVPADRVDDDRDPRKAANRIDVPAIAFLATALRLLQLLMNRHASAVPIAFAVEPGVIGPEELHPFAPVRFVRIVFEDDLALLQ